MGFYDGGTFKPSFPYLLPGMTQSNKGSTTFLYMFFLNTLSHVLSYVYQRLLGSAKELHTTIAMVNNTNTDL